LVVALFVCANCARAGQLPRDRNRQRPKPLAIDWPFGVHEVLLPCAGRTQPEHLLKAFEAGVDATCLVACDEGNCHTLDGSRRCGRRVEYLGRLLDEVGLGASRIRLFHLPGSAKEDLAIGLTPRASHAQPPEPVSVRQLSELRRDVLAWLATLTKSPMHRAQLADCNVTQLEERDESED
jgi:coenzyme F420-reducing hydrogenase delta subunit